MGDLFKKLLIIRTSGIGPVKYRKLLNEYGDIDSVVESLHLSERFKDSVKLEIENAYKKGITYIADDDIKYPKNLLNIENHPIIISVRGNMQTLSKPMVSMVGTRHSTAKGMEFMSMLAMEFAKHGYVVVSGMATGTDTSAHYGALKVTGDSQTIAVLAGGVDYIWPLENESLYYEIVDRGIIVSEMPLSMKSNKQNFIQRNRWIAGLCDVLILGEADINSGSMSTARFALQYNKKVFSIPGHPSDERSVGPNSLIKSGTAQIFTSITDFFSDDINNDIKKQISTSNEDILEKIGIVPVSESVLAKLVKKDISQIKSCLIEMELQGLIRKCDGGYVLN